jgi:hypothetical protein
MPLLDPSKYPPGGFSYFEPSINWRAPATGLPIGMVAEQVQMARAQNPFAGLNPSYEACYAAVERYTCARLKNNPRWCVVDAQQAAQLRAVRKAAAVCGGCGKKKSKN